MTIKITDINNRIVNLSGITPLNDASQFPSHYADFGFGGLRSLATLVDRDSIPFPRQDVGMLVYIVEDNNYWMLTSRSNTLSDSNWKLLRTGGDPEAGLTVVPFNGNIKSMADPTGSWEDRLVNGTLVQTVDLEHNLDQTVLNVKFYETGNNGSVFVPWEVIDSNTIRGCVPQNRQFSGLVHITSAVASGGGGGSEFFFSISDTIDMGATGWVEDTGDTTKLVHVVTHALGTGTPAVSVFDNTSNLVFLCIERINEATVRLKVNKGDSFGGYGYVRG